MEVGVTLLFIALVVGVIFYLGVAGNSSAKKLTNKKLNPDGPNPNNSTLVDLNIASEIMKDAEACMTEQNGPQFDNGIAMIYSAIKKCVVDATGKNVGFGDTIHEYALLTRHNPDHVLRPSLEVAGRIEGKIHPFFCGSRFVVGYLIAEYVSVGVMPSSGGPLSHVINTQIMIMAQTNAILEIRSNCRSRKN